MNRTPSSDANQVDKTTAAGYPQVSNKSMPLPPTEEVEAVRATVPAVNSAAPSLVLMGGALSRAFPLTPPGPLSVGKADDCQIQLKMSRVSRHHCLLELSKRGPPSRTWPAPTACWSTAGR